MNELDIMDMWVEEHWEDSLREAAKDWTLNVKPIGATPEHYISPWYGNSYKAGLENDLDIYGRLYDS